MVLNSGQCDFMCLGQNTFNETFVCNNKDMKNSKEEKIVGVTIDNKLKFKNYIKPYVKKPLKRFGLCHV